MSNSSQSQLGNPLLYSLPMGRTTLEPYWLIICQLALLQSVQRLWNRFKYKTWFLQLELVIMFGWKYRSNKLNLEYPFELDFLDALQALSIAAHFVWYCILQGSCMSVANATAWRCFNVFGYVLMNYVTASTVSLSINIGTKGNKCFAILFGDDERYSQLKKVRIGLLCLWCYAPIIAYMSIFLIYFNVNVLPMFVCYEWLVIMWVIGVSFVSALIGLLLSLCPINHEPIQAFHVGKFLLAIFISTQLTMVGYLTVLLYNYSQYWYFGDTYIHAIVSEYQSRDTAKYFQVFYNSTEQIAHTVLSTF